MKKIISLILAITLVMALMPTIVFADDAEADVAKVQTLTFGEGGLTEYIENLKTRATYTFKDGVFSATNLRSDAVHVNTGSSYYTYIAFPFTAEASGLYEMKIKSAEVSPKIDSADIVVVVMKQSQVVNPDSIELPEDMKTTFKYFNGTSNTIKNQVGRFNFSTAEPGVFENVVKDGENSRVVLEKGEQYYLILCTDNTTKSVIIPDDPNTEEDESNVPTKVLNNTKYYYLKYSLSGVQFTPVTEMNFGSECMSNVSSSVAPANWELSPSAGWIVNTAIAKDSGYSGAKAESNYLKLSFARSSKAYEPWSGLAVSSTPNSGGIYSNNSIKAMQETLMLKTNFTTEEGYYRIKIRSGKMNDGAKIAIYVDNKFAGWYDCYDENATTTVVDTESSVLNTVYLTPDEDGRVPVAITSESLVFNKTNTDTSDDIPRPMVVLSQIEFEYLGKEMPQAATPEKIVVNAPETLEVGETANISAYVEMSDGSKRHISGMEQAIDHEFSPHCPRFDNTNFIKVAASDNLTFAADFEGRSVKNGVFTNADGNATGTITANETGNATVKVTAKVDGLALSPVTVNIAVPADEPGEELNEEVSFAVLTNYAEAASGVSAEGYLVNNKATVAIGTTVSAKAEDIEGYKFVYWKDGSRFYSAEPEITYTVARNTALTAVYDVVAEEAAAAKVVEFWNADKTLISKVTVTDGAVTFPEDPEMTGYNFIGWYLDEETEFTAETDLTADVTRVVAGYEVDNTEYTVSVDGSANTGKYNDEIKVSAQGNFTYWTLNNLPMSFNSSLNFLTYGAANIASVYEENAEAVPTVVLDKVGESFFITYETPANAERLEAGIIFGTSENIEVGSCYSKASAKNKEAFGQFTAKAMGTETFARGYQIFKKDGTVRVIYTDAISANN